MSYQNFKLSILAASHDFTFSFSSTPLPSSYEKLFSLSFVSFQLTSLSLSSSDEHMAAKRKASTEMKNCDSSLIYENGNPKVYFRRRLIIASLSLFSRAIGVCELKVRKKLSQKMRKQRRAAAVASERYHSNDEVSGRR